VQQAKQQGQQHQQLSEHSSSSGIVVATITDHETAAKGEATAVVVPSAVGAMQRTRHSKRAGTAIMLLISRACRLRSMAKTSTQHLLALVVEPAHRLQMRRILAAAALQQRSLMVVQAAISLHKTLR
jgi:hypothetical protein